MTPISLCCINMQYCSKFFVENFKQIRPLSNFSFKLFTNFLHFLSTKVIINLYAYLLQKFKETNIYRGSAPFWLLLENPGKQAKFRPASDIFCRPLLSYTAEFSSTFRH